MRVVIAGGSGLIGSLLAGELIRDGHEVIVLTRDPLRTRLPEGVQTAEWDGRTSQGWSHWLEGAAAVVNLVGENLGSQRWTAERKRRIVSSRVEPGRAILEALRQTKSRPAVLIQGSAIGFYGQSGDRIVDESSPAGEDFLADVCKQWEASTEAVEELGIRRVVVRSAVVLARGNPAIEPMLLQMRLFMGGPLGSGRQWFPWIYWKDHVAAIRFLIQKEEARGPFNLIAPNHQTNAQFARELARAMGRPHWFPVPAFALRLIFGEMVVMVLSGQRAAPRRLLELGFQFQYPTAREALTDMLKRNQRPSFS